MTGWGETRQRTPSNAVGERVVAANVATAPMHRLNDPRKIWRLSALDLKSYSRWYDYSRARDAMLAATDTAWVPWYIAHTDNKRRGRLNIVSHLLSQVPYKPLAPRDVTLPRRQRPGGYVEPDLPLRYIPTPL